MQKHLKTLFEIVSEAGAKHVAVIGSGGKTGTLLKLAEEAVSHNKKVIINTTTKMLLPDCAIAGTADQAAEMLKSSPLVWAGTVLEGAGKLSSLPEEEQKKLPGMADLLLTEADGSKGLPLKYPRDDEPVLPDTADLILLLLGFDCLGKPLFEVCHHPERIPAAITEDYEETVTPELAAKILKSGYLDRLPPVPLRIVLNGSVRHPKEEAAMELVRQLPEGSCLIRTADGVIVPDVQPEEKTAATITAVLMASGFGRRFGGDKLFAQVGDRTMIEHILSVIPTDLFSEVLVVSADERIRTLAGQHGYTAVRNETPEEGISSSVRLGIKNAGDTDGAMFFVCDQPYLTEKTIRLLAAAFRQDPGRILVPEADGRRGNPCIFPKVLFSELAALQGDTGGKAVIRKHPEIVVTVPVPEKELLDIDKKEDLA